MSSFISFPKSVIKNHQVKPPLSRVELHVHLDGSMRRETLFELLKTKKLPCPGDGSYQAFARAVEVTEPKDLQRFLSAFGVFMPAVQGDLDAIKRITVEFCEDAFNNGILYVEARFCPHLMLSDKIPEVTAKNVVEVVLAGFKEGEDKFGLKARAILCCISGLPQFSQDILDLCKEFRNDGVVGIDIAGNEGAISENGSEVFTAFDKSIFEEAKKLGINRTVHAGEDGPSDNVKIAVEEMFAQRIGHGYRVMQDQELYRKCRHEYQIHFETCPTSSILTGSVELSQAALIKHPIVQFAQDNVNFSINTDDTTVTDSPLENEYQLLRSWGFNEVHFTRAAFNAAKSCFLPPDEKKELIKKLKIIHGCDD